MDPNNPASFNHRKEQLSTGRTYHFIDQLPETFHSQTTTLLCIHGFPDLWYGWRYQVKPWVQIGFRVVVPTMLGYGDTDKPADPAEYTTKKLCADLIALLDVLGIERAVVIGHDWGSYVASRMALWHPSRLLALVL
ncbi:Alpha/Beta hydrolase protein [Desarmillaria ectypa]|nr:Alpha/Beta hydrolase protein [Desarmillaria ectypa]